MPLCSTRTDTRELSFPYAGQPRWAAGKEEEQGQEEEREEGDAGRVRKSECTKESPHAEQEWSFFQFLKPFLNLIKEVYRGIEGLAGFGMAKG